jgi:hypothetical protein
MLKLNTQNCPQSMQAYLKAIFYMLYTADMPNSRESTTAIFADDTAVLATDSDPAIASQSMQINLLAVQNSFKEWRINANGRKSIHFTSTTRKETYASVHINNVELPPYRRIQVSRTIP